MLKIGEFSKLARVPVKTLRYYADLGLLKPAYIDRYSGYRYYSLDQLPRLNRILALKELGFSLVQIEQLVREDLGASDLHRLVRLKHAELLQQVQAEQARLERVAVRLRQIEQEGRLPALEVRLRPLDACLVAGIRDTVNDYGQVGELFRELFDALGTGAVPDGPPMTIYYDAEYRDQRADVEVVLPLAQDLPLHRVKRSDRLQIHRLPKVEVASVIYTGGYEGLSNAYNELMRWTQRHGYRAAGPNREIYLQGPGPAVDPSRYITEVQCPVQRAAAIRPSSKEGVKMEPRIVTKDAFTVVGIPFAGRVSSGPYDDGQNNNEIGKVWETFNQRAQEIEHICGPAIGLCFGMPDSDQPWYIAGMEVAQVEQTPAGMLARSVPAGKYAVFECTLPTLGQTYGYIMDQWQAASGYERAEGPDFELYDEKFDPSDEMNSPMYIYWPIK